MRLQNSEGSRHKGPLSVLRDMVQKRAFERTILCYGAGITGFGGALNTGVRPKRTIVCIVIWL